MPVAPTKRTASWPRPGNSRVGTAQAGRTAPSWRRRKPTPTASAAGRRYPGVAAPRGGSVGFTAQRGGFGLGGIIGQGSAVPGQVSSTPDVASLSGQPLTTMPPPAGFSTDLATPQEPSNQYAQIGNALKSIAASQQKQGQQKGGGMMGTPEVGGRPISLQQARAMFDPGKFFGMLRGAGVRGV